MRQPFFRELRVSDQADVILVRELTEQMAWKMGFSPSRISEAVLVASEMAWNHILHNTLHGIMRLNGFCPGDNSCITICSLDQGPGIPDIGEVVKDGSSSGNGFGNGLGTVKRLSDEFIILSGSTVSSKIKTFIGAVFWRGTRENFTGEDLDVGCIISPFPGEECCGDACHIKRDERWIRLAVLDALGHGIEGAKSASEAFSYMETLALDTSPEEIIKGLDYVLWEDRGVGLRVFLIDTYSHILFTCGVGNIFSAILIDPDNRKLQNSEFQHPVNRPGIAGKVIPGAELSAQEFLFSDSIFCISATDGLRFENLRQPLRIHKYPGLFTAHNLLDYSVPRDDASILVFRWPT